MIPGVTCSTCVFYATPERTHHRGGQCRRLAPVIDQSGDHLRSIWPMVWTDTWCGEHTVLADEERADG